MELRILKLAAPVFIELSLQIGIQIVDAMMLSRVSDNAAGTVGVLITLFGFLMTFVYSLSQAGSILIAHALGRQRYARAERIRWMMLLSALLMTLPMSFALYAGRDWIIALLYSFEGDSLRYASEYLSVASWSVAGSGLSLVVNSFARSIGRPAWILPSSILGNLLNAVLAYHFVSQGFGVHGVAWAGIVSLLVMILFSVLTIFVHLRIRVSTVKSFRLFRAYGKNIFSLYFPVVVEPVAYQGAQVMIGMVIAQLGAAAMAARSYSSSVYAFCFLWSVSMSQAAQYLVSHEFGKKNYEQAFSALRSCLGTAVLAGGFLALLIALTSPLYLPLFSTDPEVIRNAALLLWIAVFVEFGRTSNIVVGASLKAVGDAGYPAKIGIVFMLGLSVPLSAIFGLSLKLGIVGVGIALGIDELIRGIMNFRRWRMHEKASGNEQSYRLVPR